MAGERYIVIDIIQLPDGCWAYGLGAPTPSTRDQWVKVSPDHLRSQFEGKKVLFRVGGIHVESEILEAKVLNSLADYKNVFLKLPPGAFCSTVKIRHEVELIP